MRGVKGSDVSSGWTIRGRQGFGETVGGEGHHIDDTRAQPLKPRCASPDVHKEGVF